MQEFYKNSFDINQYSLLFIEFAKLGLLTAQEEEIEQIYYHYFIKLKENLEEVDKKLLVRIVWSLIVGSHAQHERNPLFFKLITMLNEFSIDKGFTSEELSMLYQIKLFADVQVKNRNWPKELLVFLPNDNEKSICQKAFQRDFEAKRKGKTTSFNHQVAAEALRLRISFRENQYVAGLFKADFKVLGQCTEISEKPFYIVLKDQ